MQVVLWGSGSCRVLLYVWDAYSDSANKRRCIKVFADPLFLLWMMFATTPFRLCFFKYSIFHDCSVILFGIGYLCNLYVTFGPMTEDLVPLCSGIQPGVREDTLRFSFLSFKTYYLVHYFGCNLFYLF
jgi:hypothetical protein